MTSFVFLANMDASTAAHADMWLSGLISFLFGSISHRTAEPLEEGAKKIHSDADSQRASACVCVCVRACVCVCVCGQGLMC